MGQRNVESFLAPYIILVKVEFSFEGNSVVVFKGNLFGESFSNSGQQIPQTKNYDKPATFREATQQCRNKKTGGAQKNYLLSSVRLLGGEV